MSKKVGRAYVYVMALFSLAILAYSVWILFTTFQGRETAKPEGTYFGLFAAGLGILLAISSLMRIKNRIAIIEKSKTRVLTVVKCRKCDFKIVRDFSVGDYVHKEVGACQQCGGQLMIPSIYAEESKA